MSNQSELLNGSSVLTIDGKQGVIQTSDVQEQSQVVDKLLVKFDDQYFSIPKELFTKTNNEYTLDLTFDELGANFLTRNSLTRNFVDSTNVIPIVEEQLNISKQSSERSVFVETFVDERTETVQVALENDEIEFNRVEINKPIDAPVKTRTEGNTTIIPILREEVVVTKQLILEAEIHITQKCSSRIHEETLTLRQEKVRIKRSEKEE